MSTEPPPPPPYQLNFAPLHRTVELENIHAQVTQNDLHHQEQIPLTHKILQRYMTVIGDGSDTDKYKMTKQ